MEFEGFPLYERMWTKDEVTRALALNPSLDSCEPYRQWLEQQERTVTSQESALDLILDDADIRKEAGLLDEASDAYKAARAMAYQMREDAIVNRIDTILEEMERRFGH